MRREERENGNFYTLIREGTRRSAKNCNGNFNTFSSTEDTENTFL
ncbi:MAG: hypothetical protein OXF50_24695 [Caldilineaceae bacterium]|nr:hypothetical protein [Caldilineaceae bacterium]